MITPKPLDLTKPPPASESQLDADANRILNGRGGDPIHPHAPIYQFQKDFDDAAERVAKAWLERKRE